MAWPYSKSVPGITVSKFPSSFTVDLQTGNVSMTFAEGRKLAGEDEAYVGGWSSGGDYVADNIVYYDGEYYLCILANDHTDPKQPDTETSYWTLLDTPDDTYNEAGQPLHDEIQRTITLSWTWDDFITLCGGKTNQEELTDWAFIEGPAKFADDIYDALKAASMEPLPD